MPYLPAMGGGRGGFDRARERRTWLVEDDEVWGAAPSAGGGVVGPLEVDDYLDSDQLVAPSGAAGARAGATMHVVAGHGEDEDQYRYPGDGGQLP
jgi:hypothetical protein